VPGRGAQWRCLCTCGTTTVTYASLLIGGKATSCGCRKREMVSVRRKTHGASNGPEYKIWCSIKTRCYNPRAINYPHYGGIGVTMDPAWKDDFSAFLLHIGPRPTKNHSVDRIDGSLGYVPGNVRWATDVEQNRNQRDLHQITFNDKTQCMSAWAEEVGVPYFTLASRINGRKWPIERALMTPVRRRTA